MGMCVMFVSENQRGEVLLTRYARQLTTGGGKPGQGYPLVLIWCAAVSRARTCPSQENEEGSLVTGQDCSSSSPGCSTLFGLDGLSSRTYQGCSVRTAVGTSGRCLERWSTSGTAWHGGFSTAVSSECRSDEEGCSSLEPALTAILQEPRHVPDRFLL